MYCLPRFIAIVCVIVSAGIAGAQTPDQNPGRLNPPQLEVGGGSFSRFTRLYRPRVIPPVDFANSNRLEELLRAGKLYLSLQDAIALALENNLDIAVQRYG